MIIQSSLCFISVSLPVLLTICERVLFCSASRCVSVGSVRPTKCSDLLQVKNTMFEFWGWYFIIYITWMKLRTKSTQGLGTVWCNVSLGTDRLPRRSSTNKQIGPYVTFIMWVRIVRGRKSLLFSLCCLCRCYTILSVVEPRTEYSVYRDS